MKQLRMMMMAMMMVIVLEVMNDDDDDDELVVVKIRVGSKETHIHSGILMWVIVVFLIFIGLS